LWAKERKIKTFLIGLMAKARKTKVGHKKTSVFDLEVLFYSP
jgi:hypothetical protein